MGISYKDFWNLTFREIEDISKAFKRKEAASIKYDEQYMYLQALLIARMMSSVLSEDVEVPSYEDLFESDTEEYKLKQAQLTAQKLREFAIKANEQRRLKNGRRET